VADGGGWSGTYGFVGHVDYCWDGNGNVYSPSWSATGTETGYYQIESFAYWGTSPDCSGGAAIHVQASYGVVLPVIGRVSGGSKGWKVSACAGFGGISDD
jgi:hypothetical protein